MESSGQPEESQRSFSPEKRETLRDMSRLWWLWLAAGVAWLIVSVIILQFDEASVTTVGIIIGLMFLFASLQSFIVVSVTEGLKWLYALFGALFAIAGVISLISPQNTFEAIADILGFLFLIVGIFWIIQAFVSREANELWWLSLIAGMMMIVLAFWTGGQFYIDQTYTLLVIAGIWALMAGVIDIVRAFQIRKLDQYV